MRNRWFGWSCKRFPTIKIKEILDSPNCTSNCGTDYGPVKYELEQELWRRQAKHHIRVKDRYIPKWWGIQLEFELIFESHFRDNKVG